MGNITQIQAIQEGSIVCHTATLYNILGLSNEQSSKKLLVTNGVPQGSILGPILFNIYVADMSKNTISTCIQYADDTNLYHHAKPTKIDECAEKMNSDLTNLVQWSKSTNLIFNSLKTKSLLFATKHMSRAHNLNDPDVYHLNSSGSCIDRVQSYKYLELFLQRISHGMTTSTR